MGFNSAFKVLILEETGHLDKYLINDGFTEFRDNNNILPRPTHYVSTFFSALKFLCLCADLRNFPEGISSHRADFQ
jgi:hypothetical protein